MPAIFISYRQNDNSGYAGRLADTLRDCFGGDQVFRDCEDIGKAASFEQDIRDALRSASVLLLLIGPRWLTLADDSGRPRIEDTKDYVRMEIQACLRSGLPILPVLLPGAAMPAREQLPPGLEDLALRQALALRDDRWKDDAQELVRQIELAGDLEARCANASGAVRKDPNPAIRALRHFFPDLILALGHPAGFLAKRNLGRRSDLLYASVFFCLVLILAETLIVFGVKEPESGSFVQSYIALVSVLAVGLLILSVPLWLAWRLVGAQSHYRKTLINLLYQTALVFLLLFLAGAVALVGFGLYDQNVAIDSYRILLDAPPGKGAELLSARLGSIPTGWVSYLAFGLAALINVWTFFWLFRSWAGYRLVLDKSRPQSLLAFCLFVILTAVLPLFSFWLASTTT